LFFWNSNKAEDIGVIWKPAAMLPKKFSVLETALRMPLTSEDSASAGNSMGLMVLNMHELVANIVAACDGFVTSFEFK
jgi:hypothetical protein